MKVVASTECSAPPEVAFAANMDIPNWPRFFSDIKKVDILTAGPVAIGMRFRATRLVRGRTTSSELKLAAIDAPWRLVFSADEDGLHRVVTTEIVPNGSGSRLKLTFEATPVTFVARLRSRFALRSAGGVRKQLQGDISDLAREAERRVRG